jgi:hypothetical protein
MDQKTNDLILDLLKRAAEAHGIHEQELGYPDADWPQWYAAHMTRTLEEEGYTLSKANVQ